MEQIPASKECINFDNINNNCEISNEFKTALQNSHNPKIVLVFGPTRSGKSTLLDNLLKDKRHHNNRSYKIRTPFDANGGPDQITSGFRFCGPVRSEDFKAFNNINDNNLPAEDCDLFFIDSEGSNDINRQSANYFKALLMIQRICDLIIYNYQGVNNDETLKNLNKQLVIFHYLNRSLQEINTQKLIIVSTKNDLIYNIADLNIMRSIEEQEVRLNNEFEKKIFNTNFKLYALWTFDPDINETYEYYWDSIKEISKEFLTANSLPNTTNTKSEIYEDIKNYINDSDLKNIIDRNNDIEIIFNDYLNCIIKDILTNHPEGTYAIYCQRLLHEGILDENLENLETKWENIKNNLINYIKEELNSIRKFFENYRNLSNQLISRENNEVREFLERFKQYVIERKRNGLWERIRNFRLYSFGKIITGMAAVLSFAIALGKRKRI